MLKKIFIFLLCFIFVSVSVPIVAFADDLDWKTSEFTLTFDGIDYVHHKDGTCDILNKDGSINKTLSASETEKKFSKLGLKADSSGNWYYDPGFLDQLGIGLSYAISDALGFVGFEHGKELTDAVSESLGLNYDKPLSYKYMTGEDIVLTSEQAKDLSKKITEEYLDDMGIVKKGNPTSMTYSEFVGFWSKWISPGTVTSLIKELEDDGFTEFYCSQAGTNTWCYAVNSSRYAYCAKDDSNYMHYYDKDLNEIPFDSSDVSTYPQVAFRLGKLLDVEQSGAPLRDALEKNNVTPLGLPASYYYHVSVGRRGTYFKTYAYMTAYAMDGNPCYFTSDFIDGNFPDEIRLTADDLELDWTELTDELRKQLQDATKDVTNAMDKQTRIDNLIKDYLANIGKDVGKIEDNTGDISKDTSGILEYVKKIFRRNDEFFSKLEADTLKGFQKTLDAIAASLKDIGKDVSSIKTMTELDLFMDALDELDDGSGQSVIGQARDSVGRVVDLASNKFPFSLPWDVWYQFGQLAAEPETPRFNLVIDLPQFGIHAEQLVDLSMFDEISVWMRSLQSMCFIMYLINLSRKMFLQGRRWF